MSQIRFGHWNGYSITVDAIDPVLNEGGAPELAKNITSHCYLDGDDLRNNRKCLKLPSTFSVTVNVEASSPEEAQKLVGEAVAKIKPKKTRVPK